MVNFYGTRAICSRYKFRMCIVCWTLPAMHGFRLLGYGKIGVARRDDDGSICPSAFTSRLLFMVHWSHASAVFVCKPSFHRVLHALSKSHRGERSVSRASLNKVHRLEDERNIRIIRLWLRENVRFTIISRFCVFVGWKMASKVAL